MRRDTDFQKSRYDTDLATFAIAYVAKMTRIRRKEEKNELYRKKYRQRKGIEKKIYIENIERVSRIKCL